MTTPLQMALNAARAVEVYATAQDRDPLMAHIGRVGERGQHTAQLAACMALVSIAEDVHRIADHLAEA